MAFDEWFIKKTATLTLNFNSSTKNGWFSHSSCQFSRTAQVLPFDLRVLLLNVLFAMQSDL